MKLRLALGLFVLLAAVPAYAHSPVPGIEGFYVGLIDPFSAVPQLCLLFGLGLLVAGFENRRVVWPLSAFFVMALVGIVFGTGLQGLNVALLAAAFLCGAGAAALPGRFLVFAVVMAATAGLLIGAVSIPDPGPLRDRVTTVSGSFVGANMGLLYIAGGILFLREKYPGPRVSVLVRSAAAVVCAIAAFALASYQG